MLLSLSGELARTRHFPLQMRSGVTQPGSDSTIGPTPNDGAPFQWRGACILFGVLFLGVSDTQLIPPLLPLMADELGISPGRAGLVVTVYALAAAAFALILGTASDRIGRKRLISAALFAFVLASLLTSWSSYFSTLLGARLFTGLAAGTLSTLALSYTADLYRYEHRGKAMGILSMAYFLAFVVGVPVGSLVASRFGWRWVFVGLAVATVLVFAITTALLPADRKRAPSPALAAIRTHFASRDRLAGIIAAFLTSGGLVGFITYVGVWLDRQGVTTTQIGLLLMTAGIGATIASPVSGWLSDRIGKKKVVVGANIVLAPVFILTASIPWGSGLFVAVCVLAVIAATRQAPLHALTTELVGADQRGSYVAVRNAASQLGIAGIVFLASIAFDRSGFQATAWISAVATLLLVPVCAVIREPKAGRASVSGTS